MSRAVNFLLPKIEKFMVHSRQITPGLQRIHGHNYSTIKESNPSFSCKSKTSFLLSVTNLSKKLTRDKSILSVSNVNSVSTLHSVLY